PFPYTTLFRSWETASGIADRFLLRDRSRLSILTGVFWAGRETNRFFLFLVSLTIQRELPSARGGAGQARSKEAFFCGFPSLDVGTSDWSREPALPRPGTKSSEIGRAS